MSCPPGYICIMGKYLVRNADVMVPGAMIMTGRYCGTVIDLPLLACRQDAETDVLRSDWFRDLGWWKLAANEIGNLMKKEQDLEGEWWMALVPPGKLNHVGVCIEYFAR